VARSRLASTSDVIFSAQLERVAEQVVGLGDQLDVGVLDAVVDHLHVVTGATRTDVSAAWFAINVGTDPREHRLDLLVRVASAARHDAGPV